jgi:hypothetical protein
MLRTMCLIVNMGLFEYGFDWVFESVKGWLFVTGGPSKGWVFVRLKDFFWGCGLWN